MRRAIAAALLSASLAAACAGGEQVTGDRRNVGVVTLVFSARPARVRVGQPVRFALRLTNNSGREIALSFPSAQRYDFWVERDGREVWRWSTGRFFAQALESVDVAGLETLSFTETWSADAPGTYRVAGRALAGGYDSALDGEVVVG